MITTATDREIAQSAEIERLGLVVTAWSMTVETFEAELAKSVEQVRQISLHRDHAIEVNGRLTAKLAALEAKKGAMRINAGGKPLSETKSD